MTTSLPTQRRSAAGPHQRVARAVPSGALELEDLDLPPVIRTLADRPRGLILVTGATGSGKSTTLAAIVHHINQRRAAHVVTVEDPIEFVHEDRVSRITQREIGTDTNSFHEALKRAVRQSPDVIVIGEMRDSETMSVAVAAALTGHLVLASLHTIDSTHPPAHPLPVPGAHARPGCDGSVDEPAGHHLAAPHSARGWRGRGAAEILTVTAAEPGFSGNSGLRTP